LDKLLAQIIEHDQLVLAELLDLLRDVLILNIWLLLWRDIDDDVQGKENWSPFHKEVEQILLLLVIVHLRILNDEDLVQDNELEFMFVGI